MQNVRAMLVAQRENGLAFAVEGLSKLLKEGEMMGIELEQDCWGRPLSQRVGRLQEWLTQVHQIIDEIAVSHSYR